MNGRDSGSHTRTPYAYFDPVTSSWRTCQGSLLEDSGEFCTTWPRQGTWDLGFVYEQPTSAHPMAASGSSSLLPTPTATYPGGEADEFLERKGRAEGGAVHLNHAINLLPTPTQGDGHSTRNETGDERGWKRGDRHSGTTLTDAASKVVGPLLPTPHVEMGHESGKERDWGGDLTRALLPTPQAHDTGRSPEAHRQMKANLKGGARTQITSLSVLARANFEQPTVPLLPTPGANDHTGPEGPTRDARREAGDTGGPALRDLKHLLPTPMANPENPGGGGELRAALTHGPSRRNQTGIDTMGRPNTGRPSRLLPTPTATEGKGSGMNPEAYLAKGRLSGIEHRQDPAGQPKLLLTPTNQASKHGATEDTTAHGHGFNLWDLPHLLPTGEPTAPPSTDGNTPSGDGPPNQLTIEDA